LIPAVNVIKLFWHNLCSYHPIALSFDPGYAVRAVNYAKKGFMKLTPAVNVIKPFNLAQNDEA
jgi:hypothetical protein